MIDVATLQSTFDGLAAEYVRRLHLRVESVAEESVTVILPVGPELVHGGGVLCGQAILAAADTVMLLAMIARLGVFKPMTTVQLQASFLRPVPLDIPALTIVARVLRLGKNLSYGEVEFLTPDGKLAAHATTTYALI
ncbi:MAG: PaaI family thioesterase [Caldimonas sp.]